MFKFESKPDRAEIEINSLQLTVSAVENLRDNIATGIKEDIFCKLRSDQKSRLEAMSFATLPITTKIAIANYLVANPSFTDEQTRTLIDLVARDKLDYLLAIKRVKADSAEVMPASPRANSRSIMDQLKEATASAAVSATRQEIDAVLSRQRTLVPEKMSYARVPEVGMRSFIGVLGRFSAVRGSTLVALFSDEHVYSGGVRRYPML